MCGNPFWSYQYVRAFSAGAGINRERRENPINFPKQLTNPFKLAIVKELWDTKFDRGSMQIF